MKLKLDMLKEIKADRPELFQEMSQAANWIDETSIPNVYLQANPQINRRIGLETSYGNQCAYALDDTKKILEYLYGVTEKTSLISSKSDSLFASRFKNVYSGAKQKTKKKDGILVNPLKKKLHLCNP